MGKRKKGTSSSSSEISPKKQKDNQGNAVPVKHAAVPQVTTPARNERRKIHKLAPRRPWPTVPTSASATGPRSARTEGNNYICITRKSSLASYMRRCKDLIYKDGHKALHLSAMGAAIPLLVQLQAALPPILHDVVRTRVTTGTADCQDEIIPEDEEKDDVEIQTRHKSTMLVILSIGPESDTDQPLPRSNRPKPSKGKEKADSGRPAQEFTSTGRPIQVFAEPEPLDD